MNLKKIVENINFKGKPDDRQISNIVHDSRKVKYGSLFVAISGEKSDGHDFIFEAIDKGAIAILANGRSPATDKVPILQVKNPRKIMSKIAANFYKDQRTGKAGITTDTIYLPLAEQLDMQYWDAVNGTTTWKDHIAAVKAKYPKPE